MYVPAARAFNRVSLLIIDKAELQKLQELGDVTKLRAKTYQLGSLGSQTSIEAQIMTDVERAKDAQNRGFTKSGTISPQRAGDLLGCSRVTIVRMIEKGLLSAHKLNPGGHWKVDFASVTRLMSHLSKGGTIEEYWDWVQRKETERSRFPKNEL